MTPVFLGQPFSTWSLTKLRDYLIAEKIVERISREWLRQILHEGGISWQTTKTWKASDDPECLPKMRRILDLYDHPPRRWTRALRGRVRTAEPAAVQRQS